MTKDTPLIPETCIPQQYICFAIMNLPGDFRSLALPLALILASICCSHASHLLTSVLQSHIFWKQGASGVPFSPQQDQLYPLTYRPQRGCCAPWQTMPARLLVDLKRSLCLDKGLCGATWMHLLNSWLAWGLNHLPEACHSSWPATKHKNLKWDTTCKDGLKDNSHIQLSNVFLQFRRNIPKLYRKIGKFSKTWLNITKQGTTKQDHCFLIYIKKKKVKCEPANAPPTPRYRYILYNWSSFWCFPPLLTVDYVLCFISGKARICGVFAFSGYL